MGKSKKATVLVVDDDRTIIELLKIILRNEEHIIVGQATNGSEAVKLCVDLNPDIVLLDINMPKMDGLQALEEIRKANPAVKVLMISADSTTDKVKEALNKGAVGFVVKPLKPAKVLTMIETCMSEKNKQ